MKQTAINYAKALYELKIPKEDILETQQILEQTEELRAVLKNPLIDKNTKHRIIDKVFPKEVNHFLKVLCNYDSMAYIEGIFAGYEDYCYEMEGILPITLCYANKPSEEELKSMGQILCKRYQKKRPKFTMIEDKQLMGGFVVRAYDKEYDYSFQTRLNKLKQKLMWR